jgi:BNR repeat-like domain
MEQYVAIDNVCAWPNLKRLPSGEILATIFNQPCHGWWEGDVECWSGGEDGRMWTQCGTVAAHEPGTNRMNVAVGLARNGDLVALVSGWSNKHAPGIKPTKGHAEGSDVLEPWVCRSSDAGRTWQYTLNVTLPEGMDKIIPFGDIVKCPDGGLAAGVYGWPKDDRSARRAFFLRSDDDGLTWGDGTLITSDHYGEPAVFHVEGQRFIVGLRSRTERHVALAGSEDGGKTWEIEQVVTGCNEHPANLLKLSDGRILLCYSMRHRGFYGIGARVSEDGGRRWSFPMVLVSLEDTCDGGYPSTVELDDGMLVTAYYANATRTHNRYHMGVLRWRIEEQMALNSWPDEWR